MYVESERWRRERRVEATRGVRVSYIELKDEETSQEENGEDLKLQVNDVDVLQFSSSFSSFFSFLT